MCTDNNGALFLGEMQGLCISSHAEAGAKKNGRGWLWSSETDEQWGLQ